MPGGGQLALSQEPSSRLSRGGGEKAAECGTKQPAPYQESGLGSGGGGVGMCVHVSPCSLLALCGHGPLPAPEPGLIKHFQLEGMAGLHPVRVRFI